mmetsp:Transcript_15959/g.22213  ORF Transcript_15959/g.22213 Transcript_15959/m.22213 type:complete len:597 (+) Transcript_15959:1-1791(+)
MVEANTAVGELNYLLAAERFDETPAYAVIRQAPVDEPPDTVQKAKLIKTESSVQRFRVFNRSQSESQPAAGTERQKKSLGASLRENMRSRSNSRPPERKERQKKSLGASLRENIRSMSASRRSMSESRRSLSASRTSMSASRTGSKLSPKRNKDARNRKPPTSPKSSKWSFGANKTKGKCSNSSCSSTVISSDTDGILDDLCKSSKSGPVSPPRGRSKICRETIENALRDDRLGEMEESATKYRERSIRLLDSIDPSILKTLTSDPFMKAWPLESKRAAKKAFLYAAEARRLTDLAQASSKNIRSSTASKKPIKSSLRPKSIRSRTHSSTSSRVTFEIPEDTHENSSTCSKTQSIHSHTTHTTSSDSFKTLSTKGNSSTFTSKVEKQVDLMQDDDDGELDEMLGKHYVKETLKIMQSFSEDQAPVLPPPRIQRKRPGKLPNHLVQRWKNAVNNVNTLADLNGGDLREHDGSNVYAESNTGSARSSQAIDGLENEVEERVIEEVMAALRDEKPTFIETRSTTRNPPGLVVNDFSNDKRIPAFLLPNDHSDDQRNPPGFVANDFADDKTILTAYSNEESVIFQSEAGISQCTQRIKNF